MNKIVTKITISAMMTSVFVMAVTPAPTLSVNMEDGFTHDPHASASLDNSPYPFYRLLPASLIRTYRAVIRPSKSGRCPMHPSCSRYSEEAFKTRDPFSAFIMTADRLIRCGNDLQQYEKSTIKERIRFLDPVSATDHMARKEGADSLSHEGTDPITTTARAEREEMDKYHGSSPGPDSLLYRFATELKKAGDTKQAIAEFKRLLSYYPSTRFTLPASIILANCYFDIGDYSEAVSSARSLIFREPERKNNEHLRFMLGKSLFHQANFHDAADQFDRLVNSVDPIMKDHSIMLCGLSNANMLEWNDAAAFFRMIDNDSPLRRNAKVCEKLCVDGLSLPKKSPLLAGTLAVIPGLGYLYDGYGRTALSAFLINTIFILGTIESFDNGNEGIGTTLAVFSFGWYTGNIYGSWMSAGRKNNQALQENLARFELGFDF